MNKFMVFTASIIIVLLVTVLVGFSYLQNEINVLNQHPTATPNPTPIQPVTGPPANLVIKIDYIEYRSMPQYHTATFSVTGNITNIGTQTAYNVSIHTQVWAHDGSLVTDRFSYLSPYQPNYIEEPNTDLSLAGGVTYRFKSFQSSTPPVLVVQSYWLDSSGKLTSTTMDVESYTVTPLWSDTPT
jgi:hypothetical protein